MKNIVAILAACLAFRIIFGNLLIMQIVTVCQRIV
jgi:hypothetical protein